MSLASLPAELKLQLLEDCFAISPQTFTALGSITPAYRDCARHLEYDLVFEKCIGTFGYSLLFAEAAYIIANGLDEHFSRLSPAQLLHYREKFRRRQLDEVQWGSDEEEMIEQVMVFNRRQFDGSFWKTHKGVTVEKLMKTLRVFEDVLYLVEAWDSSVGFDSTHLRLISEHMPLAYAFQLEPEQACYFVIGWKILRAFAFAIQVEIDKWAIDKPLYSERASGPNEIYYALGLESFLDYRFPWTYQRVLLRETAKQDFHRELSALNIFEGYAEEDIDPNAWDYFLCAMRDTEGERDPMFYGMDFRTYIRILKELRSDSRKEAISKEDSAVRKWILDHSVKSRMSDNLKHFISQWARGTDENDVVTILRRLVREVVTLGPGLRD